jgi:DNA-binding response OmpR family regulator
MTALRVLLVDDESCVLDSLGFLLELQGFTIAGTASDLAGAIEIAGMAEADVAILDVNLGRELVFRAADVFVARDIPIIFTSGRPRELPARFSSTTFIGKPYPPEILINRIEQLASRALPCGWPPTDSRKRRRPAYMEVSRTLDREGS